MKTLILGDTHGRTNWKQAIDAHPDAGRIVFMGDYFDSFDISGVEQLHNFNEIIRFKEATDKEVVMLIGNHDHHYLDVGETYSGYKAAHKWDFQDALTKNMHHLQIAYSLDELLFSHAGVSPAWMDNTFGLEWNVDNLVELLNDKYKHQPTAFNFNQESFDPYGDSPWQGPLWIRPRSLMGCNRGVGGLKKKFIQIVGHTQVKNIFDSIVACNKSMGGRYYLVDAMESGGYITYEDGEITAHEIHISPNVQ